MRHNKRWQNYCASCGYSWSPRGHYRASSCPRCGSTKVRVPAVGCFNVAVLLVGAALVVGWLDRWVRGLSTAERIGYPVGAVLIVAAGVAWRVTSRRKQQERQRAEVVAARNELEERARERRDNLVSRFGSDAAEAIITQRVFIGATKEMILEAFGEPGAVDEKVLKTKTKQTLKYRPTGKNQYALKITLEEGVVVGWEDKS